MATIPPLIVTVTSTTKILKALSAEYERAQAEQDKAFMTGDNLKEAIASGKIDGLRAAVRIVAGLENDAEAVALLDTLEAQR